MNVATDASGDLFIADYGNNVIEEVTPAGVLSVVAGDGKAGPPTPGVATDSDLNQPGVAADDRGDLFIADYGNNVVEKVDPAGTLSIVAGDGAVGSPAAGLATSTHLNEPSGVAVDSRGDLFIADFGNSVVERVTPAGVLSVVAGVPGQQGPPTAPTSTP
jgi:streptogramin lyase